MISMTTPQSRASGPYSTDRQISLLDLELLSPGILVAIVLVWIASLAIGFQAAVALLTAMGFFLTLIGIARPSLGLLGVGMLCTLDPFMRYFLMTGGLLRWNTLNYWLVIVALLGIPALLRRNELPIRILQGFLLLLVLGLATSPAPASGIVNILGTGAIFGLLVYFLRVGLNCRAWYWLGMVNGVLAAAGSFVYYLERDQLPFFNPNQAARLPLMACITICLVQHVLAGWHRNYLSLWLLTILNFSWVFQSGSRGAMAIGLVCLLYSTLQIPGLRRQIAYVAGTALLSTLASIYFQSHLDYAEERVTRLLDDQRSLSERTSGRSELVRGGWRMFLDNPLGVGTGGFSRSWANHEYMDINFHSGTKTAAHSGWIKVLAENGLPGIVLLGAYALSFPVLGWQLRSEKLIFLGLFVSAVIIITLIPNQYSSKTIAFLTAAAIAIFAEQSRTQERTKRLAEQVSLRGSATTHEFDLKRS